MSQLADRVLAAAITHTPEHRGKGRLVSAWMRLRDKQATRIASVPGGGAMSCRLAVPYESMVWLRREEADELRLLSRLLHPGEIFVDGGANVGLWSVVAALAAGNTGHVIAIEPSSTTVRQLRQNLSLNSLSNVTVIEAALGDRDGTVTVHEAGFHNLTTVSYGGDVPMITLDSLRADHRVAGLKVDLEGFEFQALCGARRLLESDRPWIFVEFNTLLNRASNLGEWPVHKLLKEYDYRLIRSFGRRKGEPILPGEDWIVQGYRNLLYAPSGVFH